MSNISIEKIKKELQENLQSSDPNWYTISGYFKDLITSKNLDYVHETLLNCETIFEDGDKGDANQAHYFVQLMFTFDKEKGNEWIIKAEEICNYYYHFSNLAVISYNETKNLKNTIRLLSEAFRVIYEEFGDGETSETETLNAIEVVIGEVIYKLLMNKKDPDVQNLKTAVNPLLKEAFEFWEDYLGEEEQLLSYLEDETFGFEKSTEWINRLKI